jgi:large subunit ribosomal protein L17
MRHRKIRGKLGRTASHRDAMFRNQVTSLLDYEMIETTDAKAKVLRRVADRMITLGKRGTLHARRRALAVIRDRDVAAKVFDELAARYATRPGGYTRVLKVRQRVGDAAPMSIVELVDRQSAGAAPKGGKAEKTKAAPAKAKAEKKPKAEKVAKPKAAKPEKPARGKADKGGRGATPAGKKTGRAPRAPK